MAHEERRPTSRDRRKRPILVVLFSLLPMLIGVGILAPGIITVQAVEGDRLDPSGIRITRRLSRYAHQPLLLPRDFSAGFIPELLDLEHLFSRVDYMADPMVRERARLPSFPRDFGDVIVLDDLDQRLREIVFKDPVLFSHAIASAYPPPAADLLPIGGPGPIGPGPRFDDYFGPAVEDEEEIVVPEPSTGLLLAMGLTLLAIVGRDRSSSRVPKKTPSTPPPSP